MKKKTILSISIDENDEFAVKCPNSPAAIMAVSELIMSRFMDGDTSPLDFLFGIVVDFLAMEKSGKLEKDFLDSIKAAMPEYRKSISRIKFASNTTMKTEQ